MEVERPKQADYYAESEAEQGRVSPWRVAGVPFAFTLPVTAAWEPLAWTVAVVGAVVVLFLVIGWPLAYVAEHVTVRPDDP